jgi:rRNA maturation RNase YbeY
MIPSGKTAMKKISFLSADRRIPLRERTLTASFIESIFKKEKTALDTISYIFCSDEYLLTINRDFLRHNYYTDIITFGLSGPGEPIQAEIYISVDRVRDNARNLDETFSDEMLRVLFHGVLHLCGYGDKKKSEIALMRKQEDTYLRLFKKVK